jgi:hypothetical protein
MASTNEFEKLVYATKQTDLKAVKLYDMVQIVTTTSNYVSITN